VTQPATPQPTRNLATLEEIERRLLWLSVRMIDHANHRGDTEIKVGGHQASSASMVSIMTALWFGHIGGEDKVAIKPHASPLYHSIKYLTGELDRSYLRSDSALWHRCSPQQFGASSMHTTAPALPLGSSRPSATRNSTKATSGKRSPTRRSRVSAT
jgi:pyruvate dehydrogenase complex dehydrogenase (E1) component